METLIIHPKTIDQLEALKVFAKAFKIPFETNDPECKLDHTPNKETVKAIEEAKAGKTKKIKDLDAFFNSI